MSSIPEETHDFAYFCITTLKYGHVLWFKDLIYNLIINLP